MNKIYKFIRFAELTELDLPQVKFNSEGRLVLPIDQLNITEILDSDDTWQGIARELTKSEEAHLTTAYFYLNNYEPPIDLPDNLASVQHYLEAFYHLCELELWEDAEYIIYIKLDRPKPNPKQLHKQLFIWGYHQEVKEIYEQLLGKSNADSDIVCYSNLGYFCRFSGKYEEAHKYYQDSLTLCQKTRHTLGECKILCSLGVVFRLLRKYEKAQECYQHSLTIYRKVSDLGYLGYLVEGNALYGLGDVYRSLGEYEKAQECYQHSLTIYREIGYPYGKGYVLYGLGAVYSLLGKYEKAQEYYQDSLSIFQELDDCYGKSYVFYGLGDLYDLLKNYQQSEYYHRQGLTIFQEIKDNPNTSVELANIGNALMQQGKYAESLEYSLQALEMSQQMGLSFVQGPVLNNLAETYEKMGDLALAMQYCEQAVEILSRLNVPELKKCLELQQRLSEKPGFS